MTALKGRWLKVQCHRHFSFLFFYFFLGNTSGCPLLRKLHLMDRQAAINTLHSFFLRLCSHFHFDVIIISFPLIVTGLRASIYTHWLHGKQESKIWKPCCSKRTQTGSQTSSLGGTDGRQMWLREFGHSCTTGFPDQTVSFDVPHLWFVLK